MSQKHPSHLILDQQFDVGLLTESLHSIVDANEYDQSQISLQHRVGIESPNDGVGSLQYQNVKSDIEFSEWYESMENEYIVKCLQQLPFKPVRTRIMNIRPKRCYTMHMDKAIRFHIPIDTAENKGRFIFDHGEVLQMNPGSVYVLNTKLEHTAINCHPKMDRIHIVGCLEEKHETTNPKLLALYEELGL